MTEEDKSELRVLVEGVVRLESGINGFQFRNTFGLTIAELTELRLEREVLECDLYCAKRKLLKFKENLTRGK